jgi:hypothetical protein
MQGLTSISDYCDLNRGGAYKLQYASIDQVNLSTTRQVISDAGEWPFEIQFSSGTWLNMPVFDTAQWSQRGDRAQQGPVQEQRIATVIQRMRPEVSMQLQRMEQLRFILWLTDRNNAKWLIGSLEEGLAFRSQETTSDKSGLNAYTIEFYGLTRLKAPKYDP